jgi:hypothetical protein
MDFNKKKPSQMRRLRSFVGKYYAANSNLRSESIIIDIII